MTRPRPPARPAAATDPAPDARGSAPAGPAGLYRCVTTHVRTRPIRRVFRHRTYLWLVDLDHLPVPPRPLRPLARFAARDHFAGTAPTLRAGLERYLDAQGVRLDGGRVLMLAHARVLGHVFNPLTVYWCHRPDGTPLCTVAEVHNTYGERHCYLLRPDERGRAEVPKEFYVSPFFPVDGRYRMRLPVPGARLDLAVHLERAGGRPFTATVRGTRRPAGSRELLAAALRHPWSTLAVSAAIRWQGVRLHLRGLPVLPRPHHRTQEGLK
ncbi:hypothetical protein RVR_5256 [Actinacidiphila reveromycinica]|uniref:DUF1365 domain-containing protein n=1 Tax=Actinacidiphila reveromycinica TaxID=659352 RepID=A0A7U3UUK5_9ACTN|nr:hypothetical protein RVR_5256 [Streptomyces sp. SN-593]